MSSAIPCQPPRNPPADASLGGDPRLRGHRHYGCERRLGRRVTAGTPAAFCSPVGSWDCHFYFDSSGGNDSARRALELRCQVLELFPDLTVNRPYRDAVGPHPCAMWSCELHTPAQFARFLPWLCVRRRGLSVLVHPNTGDPLADHESNCYWLGTPLRLRLELFRHRPLPPPMPQRPPPPAVPAVPGPMVVAEGVPVVAAAAGDDARCRLRLSPALGESKVEVEAVLPVPEDGSAPVIVHVAAAAAAAAAAVAEEEPEAPVWRPGAAYRPKKKGGRRRQLYG